MIVGVIDLRSGTVSMICAGHEDPITIAADGTVQAHRLEGGPPLGLVPYNYPVEEVKLAKGSALLLVTDGITEAQDASGTLYGRERLLNAIQTGPDAAAICQGLRDSVRAFEDGIEPTDDLTVMVLRYTA
jgi:serine phosphatase RsbU (regulator of sigma subunit)